MRTSSRYFVASLLLGLVAASSVNGGSLVVNSTADDGTRDPHAPYMTPTAKASCRLPSGHPEAFLEAFANVYTAAYADMVARAGGKKVDSGKSLYRVATTMTGHHLRPPR